MQYVGITYLKTQKGNCYLNMVTDASNRKISGYTIDDNMETQSIESSLNNFTDYLRMIQ
jgi:putative transposase